jgi:hypothetical protein
MRKVVLEPTLPPRLFSKEKPMRIFGWTVAVVVGSYSTYLFIKSVPDLIRYIKLSRM